MIRDEIQTILINYGCSGGNPMPVDQTLEVFKEYIKEHHIRKNKKNTLMYGVEIDNYNMALDDLLRGLEN